MGLDHTHIALAHRDAGTLIGQAATLRRTVTGAYDPVAGTQAADTVTNTTVTLIPVTPEQAGFEDSGVIEAGDLLMSMPAYGLAVEPEVTTDIILIGSVAWSIRSTKKVVVGSSTIHHILHLRK